MMTQCAELCRIALDKHTTPVSRMVSIAVKMLKREMPEFDCSFMPISTTDTRAKSIRRATGYLSDRLDMRLASR